MMRVELGGSNRVRPSMGGCFGGQMFAECLAADNLNQTYVGGQL